MTVLLAVLISGVLLDHQDRPMSNYHITFIAADGRLIEAVTTDKDGKFQVDLPGPGIYRFQAGFNGTWESITVDNKTPKLRLKLPAPPPQPPPHVIELIQGTHRDIILLPGPPAPPPQPPQPHVIEPGTPRWYHDIPLQPNPNPKA
jgi:hypothetical protein